MNQKRKDSTEINSYMHEAKKYKLLSKAEEIELGNRVINGEQKAIDTLVVHNLRLVVKLAKYYERLNNGLVKLGDLVQEGNIGLIKAAKKFSPSYNVRFASYATTWIRHYMLRHINLGISIIGFGSSSLARKLVTRRYKVINLLNTVDPTERAAARKELALDANVTVEQVIKMEKLFLVSHNVPLDEPLESQDSDNTSDGHNFTCYEEGQEELLEKRDLNKKAREILTAAIAKCASKRTSEIVQKLWFSPNHTGLKSVANEYKVTRQNIQQMEAIVMRKLSKHEGLAELMKEFR